MRAWGQDSRIIQQMPYSYRVGYASQGMLMYCDTQECEGSNLHENSTSLCHQSSLIYKMLWCCDHLMAIQGTELHHMGPSLM